jgi:hypothetical protein
MPSSRRALAYCHHHQNESTVEAETDVLPDIALLDAKIVETEVAMKVADTTIEKRRLKIKREDLMRLRRIEQIYVCSTCVHPYLTVYDEVNRVLSSLYSPIGCLSC